MNLKEFISEKNRNNNIKFAAFGAVAVGCITASVMLSHSDLNTLETIGTLALSYFGLKDGITALAVKATNHFNNQILKLDENSDSLTHQQLEQAAKTINDPDATVGNIISSIKMIREKAESKKLKEAITDDLGIPKFKM